MAGRHHYPTIIGLVAVSAGLLIAGIVSTPARADSCGTAPVNLTAAFAAQPDGLVGADYQRPVPLPDGRTLWLFQDAYVGRPGRSDALVHNVAIVQDGACFDLRHGGSAEWPAPWIAAADTEPFDRWFWPLGATVLGDGTLRVFMAELRETGSTYLREAAPVATWLATIDLATLTPTAFEPAPHAGPELYGWSVVSDARHTYLYAHCYRQFGAGFLGHHACTSAVTVARTSHDLTTPLRYWNGKWWSADASAAANIAPSAGPDGVPRVINPVQVAHVDGRWIAVTKEGDWWGSRIYLDRAPGPQGPWTTTAVLDATAPTDELNTYFASLLPIGDDIVIGLSGNRWDGRRSDYYRPTFRTVPLTSWA